MVTPQELNKTIKQLFSSAQIEPKINGYKDKLNSEAQTSRFEARKIDDTSDVVSEKISIDLEKKESNQGENDTKSSYAAEAKKRFRVVKRMAREPFERGRWLVDDKDKKKLNEINEANKEKSANIVNENQSSNMNSTSSPPPNAVKEIEDELFCTKVTLALDLVKSHINQTLKLQEYQQTQEFHALKAENSRLSSRLEKLERLLNSHNIDYSNI